MGVVLNGESVAPGLLSRLNALSLRLEGEGYPRVVVASGRRARALQEQIFRARYLPVHQANGRNPYNDKRFWQGIWWVRVNPGGTVLPPGSSTHEDPPARGTDLAWPYNNSGTDAHKRLVQLAPGYGIEWSGRNFGEDWHFDDRWDPYASFAAVSVKPLPIITPEEPEEEDDMFKPTVHVRKDGAVEATLAHPAIGSDLDQYTGPGTGGKRVSADGKVTVFRGFMVTSDAGVHAAWARTHAKGLGGETSRTDRGGYIDIQVEASRVAVELDGVA